SHVRQNVDRDRIFVHAIRLAVPVVEHVEAFLPRRTVVDSDEPVERNLPAGDAEHVGAHAVAQTKQRRAEGRATSQFVDDLAPDGSGARRFPQRAGIGERHARQAHSWYVIVRRSTLARWKSGCEERRYQTTRSIQLPRASYRYSKRMRWTIGSFSLYWTAPF